MKLVVVTIAAAALASACASTAPQQQLPMNTADCGAVRSTHAVKADANAIEATAHCASAPGLTPDRLHARVSGEARSRYSQGRN